MSEPSIPDDAVTGLYGGAIEGFIAARDALVMQLQSAGRAQEAALAKALRKPTVPAWALDQLARRDPNGIQALEDASAEIRAAQQAMLTSGQDADRFRSATTALRAVVKRLASVAGDVLLEAGKSPQPHMDAITATLEAASTDLGVAERLRSGMLDRAVRKPAGFGDAFGLQIVPDVAQESAQPGRSRSVSTKEPESPSKVDLGRLRRDRDAAAKKALQTRDSADRLADQLAATQSRLGDLRDKHAAAEARALEAELDAKRAEEALRATSRPKRR